MKKVAFTVLISLAVVSAVCSYVWSSSHSVTEAAQKQVEDKYDKGVPNAQDIVDLVNEERRKVGVAPIVVDENVRISAQMKADDMLIRNYYSHKIPGTEYTLTKEMADFVNKSCVSSGENIHGGDITSRRAMRDWMNSTEGHREAILNPQYTKIGVGVASKNNDPSHNRLDYHYIVQHFCVAK